ncbi:putative DNA polymerase subunit [Lactococcus phage SK1]|uniref:Putative DNA polymerase subunit n=1 Tax=Lactococcus phage SK1 TaxID=2905675 RepID=O21912_BPLSK|nr:putative DNA polymerase subunit [Lactococcus phage SK1]AAB70060.1 putative DNA polymerase subunit [Lactococcus phage SK1]
MTSLFDKVSTAKELKESDDFAGGLLWNVQDILPKGSLGLITGSERV